jgi:acyl-CoA thioesterase
MSFAAASAITPVAGSTTRYEGAIEPGWDIVGNANGGYLLAIAARAASQAAGGLCPVAVTGHFLNPGKAGPVSCDVAIEKRGSRITTVRATLTDERRPLLAMLGSFAGHAGLPSVERVEAAPPELPDPDLCIPIEPTDTFPPPFMGKVELRLHPDDASFSSGIPRFRGWFRLRGDEPVDCFGLLVAVDAFPPTVFNAQLPIAWTPTLELTTHVRSRPLPGWLRCEFTTRFISGGFLEEDGEVWDTTGRLVAQSRQLALLPR